MASIKHRCRGIRSCQQAVGAGGSTVDTSKSVPYMSTSLHTTSSIAVGGALRAWQWLQDLMKPGMASHQRPAPAQGPAGGWRGDFRWRLWRALPGAGIGSGDFRCRLWRALGRHHINTMRKVLRWLRNFSCTGWGGRACSLLLHRFLHRESFRLKDHGGHHALRAVRLANAQDWQSA